MTAPPLKVPIGLRVRLMGAFAVLYVCSFVNFDGYIAIHNVRHCREVCGTGPRLDLEYLGELGVDALPALRELDQTAVGVDPRVAELIAGAEGHLAAALADWRGWTYRRHCLRT